jgi:acetyltransferase-like isoleucine patch superfamily enzyme
MAMKTKIRKLLSQYNTFPYDDKIARYNLLKEMFGSIGANVSIGNPFICDYGQNIYIGNNVSINMNCTFVDCNKITVGSRVLIASNVQIYTAAHPVELNDRLTPCWTADSGEYFWRTFALPVTIEDDCWIGGGVIIVPGVTIGRGTVIGAGSVVTKDIPANSLAVGNPCRVIRNLNGTIFLA